MTRLKCFVIMPFRADFNPVFEVVRAAAARAVPGETIDCIWLKDVHAAGKITDDILDGLQKAALCIADVTDNNPNVMWETGYAMALGKPTILIGRSIEALPFDLKVHKLLPYDPRNLKALSPLLAEAVRQTLARYDLRETEPAEKAAPSAAPLIAVTGTMSADPLRTKRRIETLLEPYRALGALWYCGSNGIVDEIALDYLVRNKQHALAVGYHRFDLSKKVFNLVKKRSIGFLDASVEALPRGLQGPSKRDVLFASKADLVVLLWDGKSPGTRQLIEYFQRNAKNLLIGFIE